MKITFNPNHYVIDNLHIPKLHEHLYCIFDLEEHLMNRREAEKLLKELNDGRFITNEMFQGLDIDSYLDKRDDSAFADEWMSAYQRYVQDADSIAEDELLRASREQAFKQTLHHTGDPALAGYVVMILALLGLQCCRVRVSIPS